MPNQNTDDDEFPGHVEAMADRLGLKGRGREQYIDDHMTGAGYKRVTSYAPGGDDDDDGDDNDRSFGKRYGGGRSNDDSGRGGRNGRGKNTGNKQGSRRGGNSSWYDE